ncbi:MAG TPA: hypothetical protein VEF91_04230, partial [Verrucomicrobiae bacterium]|nr:hypothetical protein [Verrucomicrobiae bacterium]
DCRERLVMAKTETSKDRDYAGLIEDLIQKIDNEKALFNLRYQFDVYNSTVTITGLLWVVAIVILALPNNIAPLINRLTLFIAVIAILFAFAGVLVQDLDDIVITTNFKKAVQKFKIAEKEEEKRLLLMALIKMKAMNHHSKLGVAKKLHPDMFTKEKLLERLYRPK